VKWLREAVSETKSKNLFRQPVCIESSQGPRISINGKTFLNFSSNDYLNLSQHPDIIKAAMAGLKKYGFGSGASRLLSGTYDSHRQLERNIASFKKTESALVFNTGYAANTGIIDALAGKDSVVFSDELNHASIIDGARLSVADVKIYRHRDVNHLESLLNKNIKNRKAGRGLIVTDTVFSMDGDIAPLKDLISLSKKFNTLLMIDDAHAMGVVGKTGRGGLEYFGIKSRDIIQMGTLSKAAGCFGGFVAGNRELIDLLVNRARSFIYSTSLPPAVAVASIRAIKILDSGSDYRRKKLWKNRERMYQGLKNIGFDTIDSETPIIPVMVGETKEALRIGSHLYSNKIFTPAIRPPTVSEGKCRIRFTVTAGHTYKDIDMALEAMKKIK
jgi:8-amino-7-oxononanoate synthase